MSAAKLRTVEMPIFVRAPPTRVFAAISNPKLLTRWFMDRATLSPRTGGRYAFTWEGGPTHTGKVVEFVRGKSITFSWQRPGLERLGATKLKIALRRKAGGTVVTFTHTGFRRRGAWVELYDGAIRGWTYFMMNLKSVVETGHDLRSKHDG